MGVKMKVYKAPVRVRPWSVAIGNYVVGAYPTHAEAMVGADLFVRAFLATRS